MGASTALVEDLFGLIKVSRTNNDPAVVAGFFFEAVQSTGGCPTILRTDNGTENTVMAASVQSYLRSDSQDEHAGIFQCKLSVKKISFATSFFMNQTLTL